MIHAFIGCSYYKTTNKNVTSNEKIINYDEGSDMNV